MEHLLLISRYDKKGPVNYNLTVLEQDMGRDLVYLEKDDIVLNYLIMPMSKSYDLETLRADEVQFPVGMIQGIKTKLKRYKNEEPKFIHVVEFEGKVLSISTKYLSRIKSIKDVKLLDLMTDYEKLVEFTITTAVDSKNIIVNTKCMSREEVELHNPTYTNDIKILVTATSNVFMGDTFDVGIAVLNTSEDIWILDSRFKRINARYSRVKNNVPALFISQPENAPDGISMESDTLAIKSAISEAQRIYTNSSDFSYNDEDTLILNVDVENREMYLDTVNFMNPALGMLYKDEDLGFNINDPVFREIILNILCTSMSVMVRHKSNPIKEEDSEHTNTYGMPVQ